MMAEQGTGGSLERMEKGIGKLIALFMNESVLNPGAREEIEGILGRVCLSEDALADIRRAIRVTISELIDRTPYLSCEQSEALSDDVDKLFDKLADIDLKSTTEDPVEYFEEKCLDLKSKIRQDFPFKLKNIPTDVLEKFKDNPPYDVIKGVIDDVFGNLIINIPQDDRLRLEIKIDRAITENIERFKNQQLPSSFAFYQ